MARHKDDSLKYYNQDTRDDDNLQYVEAEHGFAGYAIVHKLWKHIYGGPGGYVCPWDEINKKLFCKNNGIALDDLNAILETCFKPGIEIFNREMVEMHKVLTSKGVQKRWLKIVKECGRTRSKIDEKYNLLPVAVIQQIGKDVESTAAVLLTDSLKVENDSGGVLNSSESTQRKGKERKENETKKELCGTDAHAKENFLNQEEKKKTSEKGMPGADFIPPEWNEVSNYFFQKCKNYWDSVKSGKVARKFYDHFKSQGWKTAADAQLVDWMARAEKWILEDLEMEKSSVPREQNTQNVDKQNDEKTRKFIQEIFEQFKKGGIKQDSIPADIYNFLVHEGILQLDNDEKANYLQQCNNDEVPAKKMAIVGFFKKLEKAGIEKVFTTYD